MHRSCRSAAATAALAVMLAGTGLVTAAGQEPDGRTEMALMATSATTGVLELRRLDGLVDAMARTGELTLASQRPDRQLPGRVHEGFRQYHEAVPVHGGGVSRQLADGATVSIFGTIHQGIDLDTTPRLSPGEALALIEREAEAGSATDDPPALVVLPHPLDGYVLAYRATMRNLQTWFLDAHRGAVVHAESVMDEQTAVGVGAGIGGQRKKVIASQAGASFQTYDRLRPAEIVTLDLRYDDRRADDLLDPRGPEWTPSDVASDADNDWDDPAVVDGHAHTGFTYDYLFRRHGWNGMDGQNGRMLTMVNIARGYANAFFIPPPFGPEGTGVVAFGERPDGTPFVPADIVAHEVMHGVTHFSVSQRTGLPLIDTVYGVAGPSEFEVGGRTFRCGERLRYPTGPIAGRWFRFICEDGRFVLAANHGGAINEAFSDIVGTGVEFSLHEPGTGRNRADYLIGEDTGFFSRSLDAPGSRTLGNTSLHYPDAYSGLIRFLLGRLEDNNRFFFSGFVSVDRRTIVSLPTLGYSGVHWNSTALSHAFYLAIEGGRNATTGRTVDGVGAASRDDVERVFLRAMTDLLPARTSIPMAAAVIRQSAVDLFGAGSATHRALDQALSAVGL